MDAIPRRAGSHPATIIRTLALAVAVLAAGAGAAGAHAFPDHSEPRVGSTVTAPDSVRIWFDGAIEPMFSTIRVMSDGGQQVDRGDGRVNSQDRQVLEVTVPPLPPGRYRVFWSVVARDGHRTEGDFPFRVK